LTAGEIHKTENLIEFIEVFDRISEDSCTERVTMRRVVGEADILLGVSRQLVLGTVCFVNTLIQATKKPGHRKLVGNVSYAFRV
jgi:hypothetical protein